MPDTSLATVVIFLMLIALWVYAGIRSDDFRSAANISSLLEQSIPLGLAAIGQLVVILSGGFDISIGMIARFVALLAAVVMQSNHAAIVPMIIIGLVVGAMIGALNGLIITATGAAPFMVTLGMFGVLEGASLAVTQSSTNLVPFAFLDIYTASVRQLPIAVIAMAGIWLIVAGMLRFTWFGRDVYAIGGGGDVARVAGIHVHRTRVLVYSLSGLFGAAAGLFLLSRTGVGNNSIATNLEFQSIVAVALGGASLFGGRGNVLGTLGAVLLLTSVNDIFQILAINPYYENIFQGGIILAAIILYTQDRTPRLAVR